MNDLTRVLKVVAVAAVMFAGAAACRSSTTTTTTTGGPTPTGSFELVGHVDSVTLGTTPEIQVPQSTPTASDVPSQAGVMKLTVQSSSDELRTTCGVNRGDSVSVFWLTSTRFDPGSVLANLESSLTGSHVSAQGRIFASTTSSSTSVPSSPAVPSPTATATAVTPSATISTTTTTTSSCVLVADHVEVSQGVANGPTGTRATASPSASPSASPTARTSFPPGIVRSPTPTRTP